MILDTTLSPIFEFAMRVPARTRSFRPMVWSPHWHARIDNRVASNLRLAANVGMRRIDEGTRCRSLSAGLCRDVGSFSNSANSARVLMPQPRGGCCGDTDRLARHL